MKAYIFAASLFILLLDICNGSTIGICYGRNADDLPTPDKVAHLIQLHKINHIRIYDYNAQVFKAFANTGVELMIGVPNSDLLSFSRFQSNVDTWLNNSILPYYPATKITHVTVGAEATEIPGSVTSMVVPAMQNVFNALRSVGLQKRIKVSTTHSLGVLSHSYPPSSGAFNSSFAFFLKPLLEFLAIHRSPFMVDVYPYYAYRDSPKKVSLGYALFESSTEVIDPNTGLIYKNMFDAQVDAIYYALQALNFKTLKIVVTETGWPSKGSMNEKSATPDNAQTYNTNLIRHVINNTGTPTMVGKEVDVYIFSLFNENRKPGSDSERNWGLFYPDQTSVYSIDMNGRGVSSVNVTGSNGTWCVASSKASDKKLENALNWVCGKVDCSAIQPSQSCFLPDNLVSHASYAFNSFYQQSEGTDIACDFGGAGIKVLKNPSYDNCFYVLSGNKTSANNLTQNVGSASSITITIGFSAWIYVYSIVVWL